MTITYNKKLKLFTATESLKNVECTAMHSNRLKAITACTDLVQAEFEKIAYKYAMH